MSLPRNVEIIKPISGFGELMTVERTPLIELKSALNDLSVLRNVTTTAGSASVSVVNSEYQLATTATASDSAILDSAERGRYMPGYAATCGIGIRESSSNPSLTGDMEARWGYYDNDDGYFFGEDSTGKFVAIRRAGSDTKVYQSSWNGDRLNGVNGVNNPSGLTLDFTEGNIYQINYAWYGYGVIEFQVVVKSTTLTPTQKPIIVHSIIPSGQTSIEQPNLPIRVEVLNGATATAHTWFVGGRQYTISGKYDPNYRITGEFRGSVATTTTFKPLISFRRKTGSKFQAQSVKLGDFEAIAGTANHIIGFVLNGTLTSASWGTPTSHTASETVVESDVAATAISNGTFIGGFHIVDASNKGRTRLAESGFNFDFIEGQHITMVARTVSGTDSMDLTSLDVREEW